MENLTPDVSVILPVKCWRHTTLAAVSSLLAQTHTSFEILLIGQDDVELLRQRLPSDPRIRPLAREQPGIVGALNTGLANARGNYIARMDDDDIAYPHRLESQLHFLQTHPHVHLSAARIRFIGRNGQPDSIRAGNQRYASWLNSVIDDNSIRDACWTECPMPHPTLLAHRDVWQQLGGYRSFDGPEDYDLILRAMLSGIVMGKPGAVLQDWREHDQRLTYQDARYRREAFTHCKAWAACHPQSGLGLDKGRSVWICGTGRSARYWHDALTANGADVKGFADRVGSDAHRQKRNKPVINYEQLSTVRRESLVITALSQPPARIQLKQFFDKQRWRCGVDYILGG